MRRFFQKYTPETLNVWVSGEICVHRTVALFLCIHPYKLTNQP